MSSIEENIKRVRARIEEAATRAGRDSSSITLVAAAKGVEPEPIKKALAQGIKVIGENRVQEALRKRSAIGDLAEWHLIGHLQTNKVKKALEIFSMIQSLDSLRLAEEISKRAEVVGREIEVLVEVNTSGEPTKYGVSPEEAVDFLKEVSGLKGIRVRGLFTVGVFSPDPENTKPCFRTLRELKEAVEGLGLEGVSMEYLSMGMTNDFETAIEEGSNMVRIGTGIFGPRPT